jgi:hypothetical protein
MPNAGSLQSLRGVFWTRDEKSARFLVELSADCAGVAEQHVARAMEGLVCRQNTLGRCEVGHVARTQAALADETVEEDPTRIDDLDISGEEWLIRAAVRSSDRLQHIDGVGHPGSVTHTEALEEIAPLSEAFAEVLPMTPEGIL